MPQTEICGFRETVLELETVRSYALHRHPWVHSRKASHIARLNTGRYGASTGMHLVPGECWIMTPTGSFSQANFVHADWASGVITAAQANLGAGIRVVKEWLKPTGTTHPGVTTDAGVVASGLETFVKDILSGLDWSSALLAGDQAAFPKPNLDSEWVQVDRVLSGTVTYPPNTPFALVLYAPETPLDNVCTFYFGGPTAALNKVGATVPAGIFAANIRSSGEVVLYEAEPGAATLWPERERFQLGDHAMLAHRLHTFYFIPFSRNRLAIIGPSADAAGFQTGFTGRPVGMAQGANRLNALYRDDAIVSGHTHSQSMTGAGTIRMDRVQTDRTGFRIVRCFYPTGGLLVDLPFHIDTPVKAGMKLHLTVDAEVPSGTAMSWTVYNSQTGIALVESPAGQWALWPGQQSYHVAFAFASDTTATPILRGYEVTVDAVTSTVTPQILKLQPDREGELSVTSAGTDPSTATAHCVIEDRADPANPTGGTGGILRTRARIPCRIKTRYDAADPSLWATLHEGETSAEGVESFLRYLPDGTRYYSHDVSCGPAWNRVLESLNMNGKLFHEDPLAPVGTFGRRPPWKITDIVRYCFVAAGVDPGELDIPDIDFRLWLGPGAEQEDFLLAPQQKFAPVILRYVRDYLGGYIVRDSNAGTVDVNGNAGLWRLLFRPAPPYTPLMEFRFAPDVTGGLVHHPGAYTAIGGIPRAFIQEGTYRESTRAPEFNYLLVIGAGGALSNGAGIIGLHQSLWNPRSYTLDPANPTATDPTHPDYIGHEIPALYVDMTLRTPEAVDYVTRRMYDRGAHGERSRAFRAPGFLVRDPNDSRQVRPRLLRTGDVVTVPLNDTGTSTSPAVVRTARLDVPDGDQGGHWYDIDCVIAEDGGVTGGAQGAFLRPPLWEREKLRVAKLAAARLGLNVDIQRIYVSEITTIDQAIELLTLPTDPDNDHNIQDPTTGDLYFISGISDPFSSDLLL